MITRRTFTLTTLAAPAILRAQTPSRVVVVGAGSAGLTAAYHLTKAGVDVQVLEAANRWGGRMMRLDGFSDVPLDLGAEWIHTDPTVLGEILGETDTDMGVETIRYNPQTYQLWDNGTLKDFNLLRHAYEEVKFKDTTWYGFFERFVMPSIADRVRLNTSVTAVTGDGVRLTDGTTFAADHVILTVPLSVLQKGQIAIAPALTPPHLAEVQNINFGNGFKVFFKFTERFYPDILTEGGRWNAITDDSWDQKIYYNAVFDKPTKDNLLGLFTVAEGALPRADLTDQALINSALAELTDIFGPVVRDSFQAAKVQNWTQASTIMGSYSMSNESDWDPHDILAPVAGKLSFASEALGGDNQSTVHGAAFSAIAEVQWILSL